MRECYGKIENSVFLVRDTCRPEEFVEYRTAVGQLLGNISIDILRPIYQEHPDLKPRD